MQNTLARPPLIGSLWGYGGLDLGVLTALGGTLAWHAEVNPDASRILARHWPGVPNLGDITSVDWSTVPRVCVLTAGFPCQRRLGRRPTGRTQLPDPFRAVAARRPCGRGPPTLFGGDRECARPPHLARRFPWRHGILPVVSGRHPRSASSAGTRCRTRIPGRPPVRRKVARASGLRYRSTASPRADLPRRLACRAPCSRRRPATSRRTAARNIPPRGRAGATARTWPTRSSGSSCRLPRRRCATTLMFAWRWPFSLCCCGFWPGRPSLVGVALRQMRPLRDS
ncbi:MULTISPECIES: DNA cytosine methyltransferase [Streptomycetaceae]|uniref:DNA cytosine methyltransferase n=1 Tax=Streptomyces sp. SID5468 TaxID=2690295 RepID=UPI0018D3B9BC|nr:MULTISPECIES: DNA cytosine methyltransferase [Streptomycetaceae]